MTSIPRRFASARTSSITGSAPWAPVPTMRRLPPQGISSPRRKRRVAELFAELLGRSFLPFPHFAAVDHHIMRVTLALDFDLAKFDQSCFHISIFRWLDLQGNDAVIRVYDEAGNVIETHEHTGGVRRVLGKL